METMDKSLELIKLMKEVMFLLRHHMSSIWEDSGITMPQGFLLGMLSRSGKMKVHDLSLKLSMTDSTVSGIIDRLEKNGMVERTRSLEDKRVVYVSISPKFEEMHRDFRKDMEENIGNVISKGTPEELEAIDYGLNIMKRLMTNQ